MPLVFTDIARGGKVSERIRVNGASPIFANSAEYRGADFEMTLRRLSPAEKARVRESSTTVKKGVAFTDADALQAETFVLAVVDWSGFQGRDQNGDLFDLPCDDSHKRAIAEAYRVLTGNVYTLLVEGVKERIDAPTAADERKN